MLYNEERPSNFDNMIGQKDVVINIRNQSIEDKFFNVYKLIGQFGSGKTSMSRIISLAVNCEHKDEKGNPCLVCESCKAIINSHTMDVIEMDGASNTGVDAIRDLKETVAYMPIDLKKKIYIIDEVHMLSKGAFNSLLKILEEPPEYVIFILCTTDEKALPATIISRGPNYRFKQICYEDIVMHIKNVATKHQIEINNEALSLIAKNSRGSLRDALSLLEQVSKSGTKVTAVDVTNMLGISDPKHIFELIGYLMDIDTANCINSIENIVTTGKDLFLLVSDMLDICADGVVASCSNMDHIYNTELYKEQLLILVNNCNKEQFCTVSTSLISIRDELRKMPTKTTLVIGIIRMTHDVEANSNKLLKRIEELEKMMNNHSFNATENHLEQINPDTDVVKYTDIVANMVETDTNLTPAAIEDKNDNQGVEVKGDVQDELQETLKEEITEEMQFVTSLNKDETVETLPEDIVKETKNEDNNEEFFDMFDMMDMFGGIITSTKAQVPEKMPIETKTENTQINTCEEIIENKKINPIHQAEIEKVEACLNTVYQDNPVLENAIELGCIRTVIDEGVVFITSLEPIYKLINKYIEIMDLPFEVQYVA